MINNFYQCLRCNYQTTKSHIIKSHLNKKNKCLKTNMDSLKYSDNEIYELSSIKVFTPFLI